MALEIISEKDNLLFSRKEVILAYEAEVIPSKEEARNLVADKFKSKPELVRIQKVEGKFGSNIFRIIADIYSSQEEFDRLVNKTKKELEEEKKAEEAKKAAEEEARKKAEEEAKAKEEASASEEKPIEEKKEESSEEKSEDKKEEKKE
jgi:ribosomal protein S24E